jgi:hypothetical protein
MGCKNDNNFYPSKMKQPLETWHPTPSDDDTMDQYDYDEPNIAKHHMQKIIDTTTDPD